MHSICFFIFLLSAHFRLTSASTSQFQKWYPQYERLFSGILRNNCSREYEAYLHRELLGPQWEGVSRFAAPVVDCLLEATPEASKADMAGATVLLGLTPTVVALSASTLAELSLVATRRPIFGFLNAMGSPFILPMRAFDYPSPAAVLAQPAKSICMKPITTPARQVLISLTEYLVLAGAIANTFQNTYQLATQTVPSGATESTYRPLIWYFGMPVMFILNGVAFHLRISVDDQSPGPTSRWTSLAQALWSETTPCINQKPLVLRFKREFYLFLLISWFTSLVGISYLTFATVVFSEALFITIQDALSVLARFLLSAIFCRIVLMYEIAGLRRTTSMHQQDNGNDESEGLMALT